MQLETNKIIQGNTLEVLKTLPSESINCVMTSPPYWALRDYGIDVEAIWDADVNCLHEWVTTTITTISNFCLKCGAWKGQLGLEPTFDLYIKHLCDIFDEVKRVLRKDGTCWVNIGDTYYGGGKGETEKINMAGGIGGDKFKQNELADKNICLVPFRFAIEMQRRGWILRNTIIWYKRNCMPSSVDDRFTVDFEYIFFFAKSKKYWFEQQRVPCASSTLADERYEKAARGEYVGGKSIKDYSDSGFGVQIGQDVRERTHHCDLSLGRNMRCVWDITTHGFPEAHFATYPEELCEVPIKAGCPEFICKKCGKPREKIIESDGKCDEGGYDPHSPDGLALRGQNFNPTYTFKGYTDCGCNAGFEAGIVFDPFMGSGTTALVALKQNKRFIGTELNKKYIEIAMARLKPYLEQTKLGEFEKCV